MATILEALSIAFGHHQAGRLSEAETLYNRILDADPDNAAALQLLGALLAGRGEDVGAAELLTRSVARDATNPDAHFNLAIVLGRLGRAADAETAYRRVLALVPGHPAAHNNLGLLLRGAGRPEDALAEFRQAIARRPDFAEAWFNLAATLDGGAPAAEVCAVLEQGLAHCPDFQPLHAALRRLESTRALEEAAALHDSGRLEAALEAARRALDVAFMVGEDPSEALFRHATILADLGRHREAEGELRRTLALRPTDVFAWYALGGLRAGAYDYDEARLAYGRVLRVAPHIAKAHMSLGGVCFEQGDIRVAIAALRHALTLRPDLAEARSGLLFALSFDEEADPDAVFREYRRFDELYTAHLAAGAPPFPNDRSPERRLRVGYVSPNFYGHPCSNFVLPLVEQADRDRFALTCYATSPVRDALTEAFERTADRFVACHDLDGAAFAERVRSDGIDILVDCSGHLAGHRLFAFARRAAPVQVSYPLYPDTTGLSAMDYRIMDRFFAPSWADAWHSEALVRLPDVHVVFKPRPSAEDATSEPPALTRGHVTFGSFNNMSKLGDRTVAAWAAILRGVPTARLLLKWRSLGSPLFGAATRARFAEHGVEPERIELLAWTADPHEAYRNVDLALDPLIANGGTTSCEALWMGVPVLTCTGRRMFSRVGTGHLTNIGLTELIAASPEDYVAKAIALASNPALLTELRRGLRDRVVASPLMDAKRYTRFLERAYRIMWRRWCAGEPPRPIGPDELT